MASGFNPLGAAAYSNTPTIARPAALTPAQRVGILKQTFTNALCNVTTNRRIIYDVLVDIKEHHHEYGYKSYAAAVEGICDRGKSWAYNFCDEIEGEIEIYGKIVPADSIKLDCEADRAARKELASLKRVEKAREEEPEKPHIRTADEIKAEQAEKPHIKTGEPFARMEKLFERAISWADDLNTHCPNEMAHGEFIAWAKNCLKILGQWKDSAK
jgi:hypothetical protein